MVLVACRSGDRDVPTVSNSSGAGWRLIRLWTLDEGFSSPESAIYDGIRDVFYISNVNGYEENGLGYLSAVSPDGKIVASRWLDGLNAPTGMAVSGDTLYVVDLNRLAEIDILTRSIRRFYEAPDKEPGMNDITVAPNGEIFVSASELSSIYRMENDRLALWIKDDELRWANGLYADDASLYVAAFHLRRIDIESKIIERIGDDEILEDLETIEPDGSGGYFISLIGKKPIMHLAIDGTAAPVLKRTVYSADFDYLPDQRLMIIPSGGETVSAFTAVPSRR